MTFFKRYLSLFIAIGFATLSSISIYQYLQSREGVIHANPLGATLSLETIPVIVAKHDIKIGTKITSEDVFVQKWPKQTASDHFFHEKSQVIGKVAKSPVVAEEPFMISKLLDEISSLFPDNTSAVTVQIPRTPTLSRMLEEGAFVDVLANYNNTAGDTKMITRAAHVLSIESGKDEKTATSMEVTLLVKSQFAPQILYAMQNGEIKLVMSGKHNPTLEVK